MKTKTKQNQSVAFVLTISINIFSPVAEHLQTLWQRKGRLLVCEGGGRSDSAHHSRLASVTDATGSFALAPTCSRGTLKRGPVRTFPSSDSYVILRKERKGRAVKSLRSHNLVRAERIQCAPVHLSITALRENMSLAQIQAFR